MTGRAIEQTHVLARARKFEIEVIVLAITIGPQDKVASGGNRNAGRNRVLGREADVVGKVHPAQINVHRPRVVEFDPVIVVAVLVL